MARLARPRGPRHPAQAGQRRHLAARELLHHLLHHLAGLEQLVDLGNGGARPAGDPLAAAAVADDEKEELERRMMKGEFSFDDFLKSTKMLKRMGPLQGVLKMIPGLGKQLEGMDDVDERQLARVEAIVLSMTPQERRLPHVIDGPRRQRIAKGSGTSVQQVNGLLEARKQMAKMMKQLGKGKFPALSGQPGQNGPTRSATKKKKTKRKKRTRR